LKIEKRVFGVGINDVSYTITKCDKIGGVWKQVWRCPYYVKWREMLMRCYCAKLKSKSPTYIDCTSSEEWIYFSNFIKWVDEQPNRNWQNCDLDKDFLFKGNKIYSKETCVFIDNGLNKFLNIGANHRGVSMIGTCFCESNNKYLSQCSNPFNRGNKRPSSYIGYFLTEIDAHKAWQAKKHEYALKLADLQDDPRVAKTLREYFSPDKDWTGV
jgi:hypothetical protein